MRAVLLNELVRERVLQKTGNNDTKIPEDFLINHISGGFVKMVQRWSKNGSKQTPDQMLRGEMLRFTKIIRKLALFS